jgi:hypothetical protein
MAGTRGAPFGPGDIPAFQELERASPSADSKTRREERDYEQEAREARLRGLNQDIDERKKYANRTFALLCAWIALLFVVLGFQGFGARTGFALSDKVLITLITGTTVNVIGIFLAVMNYLFPSVRGGRHPLVRARPR